MSEETFTTNLQRIVCPYCGEFNDMTESIGAHGEDVCERECGDCTKKFNVYVHISFSVTASRKPNAEEPNA